MVEHPRHGEGIPGAELGDRLQGRLVRDRKGLERPVGESRWLPKVRSRRGESGVGRLGRNVFAMKAGYGYQQSPRSGQ